MAEQRERELLLALTHAVQDLLIAQAKALRDQADVVTESGGSHGQSSAREVADRLDDHRRALQVLAERLA